MARRLRVRKKVNITRVVAKLVTTVLALWVGGVVMTEIGGVMECTYSPFYRGFSLIGWTVQTAIINATGGTVEACNTTSALNGVTQAGTYANTITSSNGSGVLAVIGIIGLATIVTEFVEFRM